MKKWFIIILLLSIKVYLLYINNYLFNHFIDPVDYESTYRYEETTADKERPRQLYSNVVLVVIDGAHRDCMYNKDICPAILARWKRSGLRFDNAKAILPTVSAPNYFSILSGSPPYIHGVTNNHRRFPEHQRVRSLFHYLNAHTVSSACIGFSWYKDITAGTTDYIPVECCGKTDSTEVAKTVERLIANRTLPCFTLVHFLAPDNAAHRSRSNSSQEYIQSISRIDSLLDGLMSRLDREYPDTLIIIMADHGTGRDGNHGGSDDDSLSIPLFILTPLNSPPPAGNNGSTVVHRHVINIDVTSTIAAAVGIPIPIFCCGSIIHELFDNGTVDLRIFESIDKKSHILSLLQGYKTGGFTITDATRESSIQHDRSLGLEILNYQRKLKQELMGYQRIAASLLLLLFVVWILYKSAPGFPWLLFYNGLIVSLMGLSMGYIDRRIVYDVATSAFIVVLVASVILFYKFLLNPSVELLFHTAPFPSGILLPMIVETVILTGFFVPFYSKSPYEGIFMFRFYSLAFITPLIIVFMLFLLASVRKKGYDIA